MSGKTVKLFELCTSEDNRGLKIESIPWRFTEKDRLQFANSEQIPVLVDGNTSMKESFDIAIYLEKTYPDAPSLFGGQGGQATCRFIDNFANEALMQYFPAILPEIWAKLDKKDADYFREDREKMFGGKLEDVAKNPDPQEQVKKFRAFLQPLRETLGQQSFVGGDQPNYGDYCIASICITGKTISKLKLLEKDDAVAAWLDRVLSRFEGDLKGLVWES